MFSTRTAWDRAVNPLARAAAAARAAGPLLDLTETNPTAVGLRPADRRSSPCSPIRASAAYAPEAAGWRPAREAVAADYARRGAVVAPDHVVLTASTSEAYAHLFKVLCDPGDAVLVPRPSYPLFQFLADLESTAIEPYPVTYDGTWHLRPSDVAAAVTPRTRAVVVVSPNNPTGAYMKKDEWDALSDFCAAPRPRGDLRRGLRRLPAPRRSGPPRHPGRRGTGAHPVPGRPVEVVRACPS